MPMTWSEKETLLAADSASHLSELLQKEEFFKQDALRWFQHKHVDKFLDAIDAEESTKLLHFAATWHYTRNQTDTGGFPLLDWLWVIGPASDWERKFLKTSNSPGVGRKLVARLADFRPE